MPVDILQFSISMVVTGLGFVLIWLVARFYKAERLEITFDVPRKEAAVAIGFVVGLFLIIGVVFLFLERQAGVPLGTSRQFDLQRALSQWGVYATISFIPVLVIIRTRGQSLETVGATRKNARLSLGVGILSSILVVGFNLSQQFLEGVFSPETLFAFMYYLAVGLGEEMMFRGFLQLRCSAWLGETRGFIFAGTIMAFVHLPQRVFAVGLDPLSALVSAASLIPFSLWMGFFMSKTKNIIGPAVLHTVVNWINVTATS